MQVVLNEVAMIIIIITIINTITATTLAFQQQV
jgi:hypothetical protein